MDWIDQPANTPGAATGPGVNTRDATRTGPSQGAESGLTNGNDHRNGHRRTNGNSHTRGSAHAGAPLSSWPLNANDYADADADTVPGQGVGDAYRPDGQAYGSGAAAIEDMPTQPARRVGGVTIPFDRGSSPAVADALQGRRQPKAPLTPEQQARRRRKRLIIAAVSGALLLALLIPSLVALATGYQDYSSIKGLGEDGLRHLLAVRDDLSGLLPQSSGGTGSSALSTNLCQRILVGDLPTSLTGLVKPDVQNPAYTLLVERQGGVFNNAQVTIHPAKGVSADGTKSVTYTQTVGTNTAYTIGGTPVAQITATPTATATPSATATAGATATRASLNSALLQKVRGDLVAAQSDFLQLQARLAHPDWILSLAGNSSYAAGLLASAKQLAAIGIDITRMGITLIDSVTPIFARLHSVKSALSGGAKLITQADITHIQQAISQSLTYLADIQQRIGAVNLNSLPLKASQKALVSAIIPQLGCVRQAMIGGSTLVGAFGWLIGVDAPRNFLVQPLDRSELRASGGFAGNWGIVTIDDGKIGPVTLHNVNDLDYGGYYSGANNPLYIINNPAPSQYSWWPIANFGVRDANLSADFPTNAKLVLQTFYDEGGPHMDGLINITPVAIAHVLKVTGPLYVPTFDETVTADNLEQRIHYYEEDPAGIARDHALFGGGSDNSVRKIFTQTVARLLEARVRQLSLRQLIPVVRQMFADMQSKDIQVYLSNPTLEKILHTLRADGSADTTPHMDSFYLAQENVSVAKSTPYVTVTQHDDVTLDSKGGATHNLTVTMQYNPTGPVFGYITYREYVRLYAPAQAQLISADGFDTGQVMCTEPKCPAYPYPNGELYCPSGNYSPGAETPTLPGTGSILGSDGKTPMPLDYLGAPPNTTSDIPGLTMWGGFIVIPQGCTETLTVSWYSPNVAAPSVTPGAVSLNNLPVYAFGKSN